MNIHALTDSYTVPALPGYDLFRKPPITTINAAAWVATSGIAV
jgi:hypothetical protein